MLELLGSSPNTSLREGKGNMYLREDPLLDAPEEHLEHEQLPTHLMSKDEGLLARLGYKQGSLFLLVKRFSTDSSVC